MCVLDELKIRKIIKKNLVYLFSLSFSQMISNLFESCNSHPFSNFHSLVLPATFHRNWTLDAIGYWLYHPRGKIQTTKCRYHSRGSKNVVKLEEKRLWNKKRLKNKQNICLIVCWPLGHKLLSSLIAFSPENILLVFFESMFFKLVVGRYKQIPYFLN